MNQAIKALFFLLCAGPQVSFSCQAMELEESRGASNSKNSRPSLWPKELLRIEADGDLRRDSREIKFSSKISGEKTEPHISIEPFQKKQPEKENVKEKQVVSIEYFLLKNVMATFTAEEIHGASSWDRALISHTLARIPKEEERASIFCIAKSYFFGPNIPLEDSTVRSFNFTKIEGFDFCLLLNILTHISEKNWPFFSPPSAPPLAGPSQKTNQSRPLFEILPHKI
ncbi:MAG: hypothetical protein BGO67_01810 [Alphaproteobacteria bacterium 41-28]|nr:MAG: hypothetical protein BGO67_01810 [Alphaproteobacteria bacterium 41-28]